MFLMYFKNIEKMLKAIDTYQIDLFYVYWEHTMKTIHVHVFRFIGYNVTKSQIEYLLVLKDVRPLYKCDSIV